MSRAIPWIVLVLTAAIWGGAFPAIRYAERFVSPMHLLILRMFPTALISILIALIFYRKETFRLAPRYWGLFLAICILWLFAYHYALNVGETVLPAGPAGLLIGTYPIFTIFLASVFLGEKLTINRIVGGFVGLGGTAFLMLFGASSEAKLLDIEPAKWLLYGLITMLAPVSAAVHTIVAKPYLTGENREGVKIDPVLMTMLYMSPAAILLLPFWIADPLPDMSSFGLGFWISIVFLVIFCTLAAYIGWLWAVNKLGAGTVSLATYLVPIFSLIYSRLWLGEHIGTGTMIGAGMIIVGVVIATIGGKKAPKNAEKVS